MKLCARCGKRLPSDREGRVYSQWTRSYYCIDLDACGRRARRRQRKAAMSGASPELLARLNALIPREARATYWQDGRGPMFTYNTERLNLPDPSELGQGLFESCVYVPFGPGSRSGKAEQWKKLEGSSSFHELRRDAKARAWRLYQEWRETGRIEV